MQSREELIDALNFYAASGVDTLLEEAPVNRFERQSDNNRNKVAQQQPSQQPRREEKNQTSSTPATIVPDAEIVADAVQLAQSATTLEELHEYVRQFTGCNLKRTARNTVLCDGNPEANIMLVGEAPGRDEDEQGKPFVGRSGKLLDKMLNAIDLDRNKVYITNILPWRPPGNRTPTPAEVAICKPFVERQIELISPDLLVLIGGASSKALLNTNSGILSLRGKWQEVALPDGSAIAAMPMLHPAYLLRQSAQKRLAWQDLLAIKARVSEEVPHR